MLSLCLLFHCIGFPENSRKKVEATVARVVDIMRLSFLLSS